MEKINNLRKLLDQDPHTGQIRKNKFANDAEYLPIEYVEAQLDAIFGLGEWSHRITHISDLPDLITVAVELTAGGITRSGIASSQKKGKKLEAASSIAKAIAVKNAAASLGRVFGRNLNRDANPSSEAAEMYFNDTISEKLQP